MSLDELIDYIPDEEIASYDGLNEQEATAKAANYVRNKILSEVDSGEVTIEDAYDILKEMGLETITDNSWNREKFLNTLGRKSADTKQEETDPTATKLSDIGKNNDRHIGTISNEDRIKLMKAGMNPKDIDKYAEQFRKEYQNDISSKSMEEMQKAITEGRVKPFERPEYGFVDRWLLPATYGRTIETLRDNAANDRENTFSNLVGPVVADLGEQALMMWNPEIAPIKAGITGSKAARIANIGANIGANAVKDGVVTAGAEGIAHTSEGYNDWDRSKSNVESVAASSFTLPSLLAGANGILMQVPAFRKVAEGLERASKSVGTLPAQERLAYDALVKDFNNAMKNLESLKGADATIYAKKAESLANEMKAKYPRLLDDSETYRDLTQLALDREKRIYGDNPTSDAAWLRQWGMQDAIEMMTPKQKDVSRATTRAQVQDMNPEGIVDANTYANNLKEEMAGAAPQVKSGRYNFKSTSNEDALLGLTPDEKFNVGRDLAPMMTSKVSGASQLASKQYVPELFSNEENKELKEEHEKQTKAKYAVDFLGIELNHPGEVQPLF